MATNTFRRSSRPPKTPKKRESRLYNYLNRTIGLERLFGEDNPWPIRHFNRIMWGSLLLIIYIASNHNAERLVRNILLVKAEVDELRAHYTTLEADFMKSGKQSEISKRVATTGLAESKEPPLKIVVKTEDQP